MARAGPKPAGIAMNSFLRLLPFLRPYALRAAEAGICVVFATLLALPMPLLSIYIIDHVIANGQTHTLYIICGSLSIAVLLGLGLGLLQRYLLLVFSRRVFFDLEVRLMRIVHTLPLSFFKKHGPAYIATRISDDVRQLGALMAGAYIEGLSGLLLLVAGVGIMLTIHPTLAAAMLVVLPALVWTNLHFGRSVQRRSERVQELRGLTGIARLESLQSASTVRAFERGRQESIRLAGRLHREAEESLKRDTVVMGARAFQMLLFSMGSLLLLWYGAHEIIANRLTLGQFMAFNALVAYVYGPIGQLSALYVSFRQGLGVLGRIVELLDSTPEAGRTQGITTVSRSDVVFEDIRFGYAPRHPVLTGVECTLQSGQITAIVGPTGAGKTTLVHLLLRFFDPLSGRVLVGGHDIRALELGTLRGVIGYVEQEIHLFSGTIFENIAYGKRGAAREDIEHAAEAMNCMEFVEHFPEGLNTRIGSGGVQLSGGQKQRVALARAIIRDPRILVLDEATSSLDARSEGLVQQALQKAARGRTTLLIAHHPQTMSIADSVLVLAGGRIVEQGTFRELQEESGHFGEYYHSDRKGIAA